VLDPTHAQVGEVSDLEERQAAKQTAEEAPPSVTPTGFN
jgi:hypothetical protein